MTSFHLLLLSFVILSISVFPDYMVPSSKGLLEYLHLYASFRLFDSSVRRYSYNSRIRRTTATIDVEVTESERKGLYLNSEKSFTMVFLNSTCNITIHRKDLEQVQSFVYLESLFTSDARCENEIRRRV